MARDIKNSRVAQLTQKMTLSADDKKDLEYFNRCIRKIQQSDSIKLNYLETAVSILQTLSKNPKAMIAMNLGEKIAIMKRKFETLPSDEELIRDKWTEDDILGIKEAYDFFKEILPLVPAGDLIIPASRMEAKIPRLKPASVARRRQQFDCQMKKLEVETDCSPESLRSAMSSFIILASDPDIKNSIYFKEKKRVLEKKLKKMKKAMRSGHWTDDYIDNFCYTMDNFEDTCTKMDENETVIDEMTKDSENEPSSKKPRLDKQSRYELRSARLNTSQ